MFLLIIWSICCLIYYKSLDANWLHVLMICNERITGHCYVALERHNTDLLITNHLYFPETNICQLNPV